MAKGKQTRLVSPDRIERLSQFRIANGYSLPQLKLAMAAPFTWETLKKVLCGVPIWDVHQAYIVQWIDRYLPKAAAPPDGKTLAAGDRPDLEENHAKETAGAVGTVRVEVQAK